MTVIQPISGDLYLRVITKKFVWCHYICMVLNLSRVIIITKTML